MSKSLRPASTLLLDGSSIDRDLNDVGPPLAETAKLELGARDDADDGGVLPDLVQIPLAVLLSILLCRKM